MDESNVECNVFDFRKHIAFDINQMELPAKCDFCNQHATHFCILHRGIYCVNHISNHKGILLNQFVATSDKSELVKKINNIKKENHFFLKKMWA